MKQLLWVMLSILLNLTVHSNAVEKNMQLCLNTPHNFGATHFIVGYKEKNISVNTVSEKKEKKRKSRHVAHKKQEHILGGANLIDKNRITQSFFTSIHDIADILLTLISQAQHHLYIEAFTLTDQRIANLIIEKHKKGIDVCIIVDAGNMKQTHSKVQYLIDNNISVLRYSPALNPQYKNNGLYEPYMHHKCINIDNEVVVVGSANLTKAGQKHNIENINILRDKQAVNEHREEFERLKKYCIECK
jgi:phosphatidylserine/phosphatidylglycerophosphate/cardiolipin synthase-like enzyme